MPRKSAGVSAWSLNWSMALGELALQLLRQAFRPAQDGFPVALTLPGEIDERNDHGDQPDHRAHDEERASGESGGDHDHHDRGAIDTQGAHDEREQRILPVDARLFHPLDIDKSRGRAAERGGEIDPGALQVEIELVGGRDVVAEPFQGELVGVGNRPDAQDLDADHRREPAAVSGFQVIGDIAELVLLIAQHPDGQHGDDDEPADGEIALDPALRLRRSIGIVVPERCGWDWSSCGACWWVLRRASALDPRCSDARGPLRSEERRPDSCETGNSAATVGTPADGRDDEKQSTQSALFL